MSSLRGKKKNSKSPNEKDAGPSGRGQKSADQPQVGRPLEGKVIYLDVQKKSQKVINKLKSDLVDLGAVVEPFLSKKVTHLFSDRPEAKELSKASVHPSGASPAVSTPSPFQQWKDSGATDSPDPSTTVRMMTRGRAIANKADTSSKTKGSTDVLNNARNMGIPIRCLDKILTYVEREMERMAGAGLLPKQKRDEAGQKAKKKERQLQHYYLKVEDTSRRYRPSTKEMNTWPRVVLDSTQNTQSPFLERVPNQQTEEPAQPPAPMPEKRVEGTQERRTTPKSSSKKTAQKAKTTPKQQVRGKVRGYCECCRERYSDLDQHVESSGHQYFVKNQSNYDSLDAMINEGPNMEQFLNDCLHFHTHGQAERSPAELDEVILISEAGKEKDHQVSTTNQDEVQAEKPSKRKSPPKRGSPKSSTPRKKTSAVSSKRRRSSLSPVAQSGRKETVRTRLSPRLRSKSPKELDCVQDRPEESREEPGCQSGSVPGKDKSNAQVETTTQESVAVATVDSSMCALETDNIQDSAVVDSGESNPRSPERPTQVSGDKTPKDNPSTPVSPRYRLSLSRRRRKAMQDLSPQSPPRKRRKGNLAGQELGVVEPELQGAAEAMSVIRTSPRGRKVSPEVNAQPDEVIVVSSPVREPLSPKNSTSKPRRKQALEEMPEDIQLCATGAGECSKEQPVNGFNVNQSNNKGEIMAGHDHVEPGKSGGRQENNIDRPETVHSHSTTREAQSQTRRQYVFGSSAPGPHLLSQTVGLVQENRNFPQGTTNTSTGQPFLGHAHTDFGLNPSLSKVPKGYSEITGSEDERLRTIFRSDPVSETNFEGFSNEEIQETELLYDSFTKNDRGSLKEKLKNAALDVVYVPSSELGAPPADDRSDSDSESSEGSVEVDIVLQKVENFPSDGSEWETQVQGFMTKLDKALEVREKQTQKIQEDIEKKKVELEEKKAVLERESRKENYHKGAADQVVPGDNDVVDENVGDVPKSVAKTGQTGQSEGTAGKRDNERESQTRRSLRKRVTKSPGQNRRNEIPPPSSEDNVFKSPSKKEALREISNTDQMGNRTHRNLFSTPKRTLSQGKKNVPHVTFSPKISVEDQGIILDHYVHDASEGEISFPKLSSPPQEGWRVSPVKYFTPSTKSKPSTPTKATRTRRRSCSSTDNSRPLLFLKLKVSPSSRRRSLPTFPDSPPPSPFKSPKQLTPSKRSPPIFALLYDGSSRKRGLTTPILVTNRRPNFSKEILQPSLRLSVSKRRARRLSLEKRMPRTLAALNLSLPHIFDVFEFHDEASMEDEETEGDAGSTPTTGGKKAVKTVECGTQTPPRRSNCRKATSSARVKSLPARRRLCISADNTPDGVAGSSVVHICPETVSAVSMGQPAIPGIFEGSELAHPFDLPVSFYM